jgi:hypothetical protein
MVLSPVLAGLLLLWLGITGVMIIDLVTFLIALGTLLAVRIPSVQKATENHIWQEMRATADAGGLSAGGILVDCWFEPAMGWTIPLAGWWA